MSHDLKSAVRTLLRRPVFAIVAALTLAVGIGSATAIFSVAYALLVKPVEFASADRLVRVWELTRENERFSASGPDYLDFRSATSSFEELAAFGEARRSRTLTGEGDPVRIEAVPVTASFFPLLGVQPVAGRAFAASEDRPGPGSRRIVLGHALWRERFGASDGVIDRTITLDGQPFLVTGVMPAGFDFPFNAQAWVPLVPSSAAMAEGKELAMIGRLKPGVTLELARADLQAAAALIAERNPGANAGWTADLATFRDWLVTPRFRDALLMLLAAVACLLLLACANVANLLMAQASRRHAEMRMRVALGARRGQIVRLLLTESALLAAISSGAGLLMAMWLLAALRVIGAGRVPRLDEVGLHAPVLLFAMGAGLASCALFGLAPALHGSRQDLRSALDAGYRFARSGRRWRGAIVCAEIALAVLLLVGAGLLAFSFSRLSNVDPGFATSNVLAVPVGLPGGYGDARVRAFYAALGERVRALPAVEGAGATSTNPFRQSGFSNSVTPEDAAATAPPSGLVQAGWRAVTTDYFDAVDIPIVAGRVFGPDDRPDTQRVVIVSKSLADRLWPGGDAVGRRILWGGLTGQPRTIVGVAGDIRDVRLDGETMPILFLPHAQLEMPSMTLLVRAANVGRLVPAIRDEIRALDPALPIQTMTLVDDNRSRASAGARFNAWLVGAFALIAMTLAATGVYAMLAFAVSERRREIAIRLALGADPATIVRMVIGEGLRLTIAGLAAGLVAAAWLARYLQSLLFDVQASDPATFALVAATLVVLSLVASVVPARQASRMDPLAGLRVD